MMGEAMCESLEQRAARPTFAYCYCLQGLAWYQLGIHDGCLSENKCHYAGWSNSDVIIAALRSEESDIQIVAIAKSHRAREA